ncbi:DUF932 domain-containing protein [Polymorphospora sp. NPDC050346]|uniref:DUF932 domain-containing protein n=1 Tax=Polymorphospora sp. NPDC050346 TaxID=3155780 RepID=UPI0033F87F4B
MNQTVDRSARHATLPDLQQLLNDQHTAKLDIVASTKSLSAECGFLRIDGTEPQISESGVTTTSGLYLPTDVCDQGLGDKLGIPPHYLRKLRSTEMFELYDANVNGWLDHHDGKRYLVRCFRGSDGKIGIARAFLSDGYKIVDHIDALYSVLEGIRDSGMRVRLSCDLTQRRMIVRVWSEEVRALAPDLLRNYRSPFTGATGADNPTVFAGFVITNSETGAGAFSITPRVIVQVCNNGMTFSADALKKIHLGGRMDEGIINWSQRTHDANLALVKSQATDAVATFLDVDYVRRKIAELEEQAGRPVVNSEATIRFVSKRLRWTEEERNTIMSHFIDSGDRTAGGIMHAVTSAAQTHADGDSAYEMEAQGVDAMKLAASL